MAFLTDAAAGPGLAAAMAIEQAQTILDRILFIAFAQGTGLIARPILQEADKAFTPFSPVQKWRNFQNLFRLCERGLFDLDITAFNGGLFAPDPVTDAIVLSDDLATDLVRLSEWDYGSDVPVTMLGHIFEQSITDLERLRAESLGLPVPDDKAGQRKREGIVYTPDLVTRFLVERTLERTLAERFAALLAKHAENDGLPKNGEAIAWRGAAPPERAASERAFWTGYLAALQGVTVLDPACGAGAFLVAAFDSLAAEYRRTLARLADLGKSVDLDPFDEILSRNLHGVDLNAESVEITRLSLWLKAARRKHKLPALEATIMVGDSLVGDGAYTRRPFDYETAFPSVFARGGFDVVLGNPPYVRMEFLKKVKPYFERHFRVAADRTDLCAFFFERGVALLTPGGRLGYISSSTFFRTGSGEKLRMLLADETAIEAVVDFGDGQIFEGVTTYPAILTLRKPDGPNGCGDLSFMKIEGEPPRDLGAAFEGSATPMPRTRLGAGSWHFENDRLAALRAKIVHGRKTLGEVYGPPLYGIKTGLNDAFVIDRGTRDRLAKADPKASELMRPYVRGEHIERWRLESGGEFLLNMPKGKVDIDEYPSVRDWLLQFRDRLEGRATKQQWFELQQAQLAYQANFAKPKILFVDIAKRNPFMLDTEGFFIDCTAFMVNGDFALLAFLNSKLAWFQWCGQTPIASGGYLRLKRQYVAPTLLPDLSGRAGAGLSALSEVCSRLARQRHSIVTDVRRGILDLAPSPARRKLARKLENWHDLDFAGFLAEVRRAFKIDVPLRQRREWESFLAESRAAVGRLSAEIEFG